MPEQSDYSQAVFNPAFERLKMICRALDCCSQGRASYDAHTWYIGILDLFAQVKSKLNDAEKKELEGYETDEGKQVEGLLKKTAVSMNLNSTKKGYKINPALFDALYKTELYLRDCLEKHNLGIPDASDPRFAMYK